MYWSLLIVTPSRAPIMPQPSGVVNCGYPRIDELKPTAMRRCSVPAIPAKLEGIASCRLFSTSARDVEIQAAMTTINLVSNAKSGAFNASAVGVLHDRLVSNRRVEILSDWFAKLMPSGARVLDVGCGDGTISALLQKKRPDIAVQGIDVLQRTQTHIPVEIFDGSSFPFPSSLFDVVLFSDVLHHTVDATILLREARRTTKQYVLIKDHFREGLAANARLRFMDWVGNARFGVALPYNYWTRPRWHTAWRQIGLQPEHLVTTLGLYPKPADWFFGAHLHFIALLRRT
jgi:SAM-dependent methyltransferase